MKNINELSEANIGRLMLKFFIPAFIGVFVNALYNIVDRIFIGQGVSAEALSGVSVIFPVMLIMMGFGMLIGIGTGVLVSINLGRKDFKRAEKILGTGFFLIIIASILMTAFILLIKDPILKSFGADKETYNYARDYLQIIAGGTIFMMVGFSLNNVIRSEGNARLAMISMLISAGTNLILDPVFIFWFGWGVKGAALATVISMMILAVWVILHFRSSRSVLKLRKENIRIDFTIMKEIVAIGMAPFSMQVAGSFVQGLLNKKLIFYGGNLAAGALGIINSIATLVIMSVVAINMASQPIIGFNHGAQASERVKETLRISLIAASIVSVVAFLIVQSIPGLLIKLFNHDNEVLYNITVTGLRTALLALPLVGFQVVSGHFFQAIGKSKVAALLTLLRQVIVLIPLLYILPSLYSLRGIWIAFPIADVISALIVSLFLAREWKRMAKIEEYEETDEYPL